MSVEFLIAVTDGCRRIVGFKQRKALPFSMAVKEGHYQPLDFSDEFDTLVGRDGPLYSAGYSDGIACEMKIDNDFDGGRSWQFPVALSYAFSTGKLLDINDKTKSNWLIWSTGAIDSDLKIDVASSYKVEQKLEKSIELIKAELLKGTKLIILIPAHEISVTKTKIAQNIVQLGVTIIAVEEISAAIKEICTLIAPVGNNDIGENKLLPKRKQTNRLPIFLILVILIGGVAYGVKSENWLDGFNVLTSNKNSQSRPNEADKLEISAPPQKTIPTEVSRAGTENIRILALSAGPDRSCVGVITSFAKLVETEVIGDISKYLLDDGSQSCGIAILNQNNSEKLWLQLPSSLSSRLMDKKASGDELFIAPSERANLFFRISGAPNGSHILKFELFSDEDKDATDQFEIELFIRGDK